MVQSSMVLVVYEPVPQRQVDHLSDKLYAHVDAIRAGAILAYWCDRWSTGHIVHSAQHSLVRVPSIVATQALARVRGVVHRVHHVRHLVPERLHALQRRRGDCRVVQRV